jgi:nucleoside-diphosphate-sugar epimerase
MNVLVTGGCGYIGVWLVRKLTEAGHTVRVVDKCLFPSGVAALAEWAPGAELVRADIRRLPEGVFDGIDAVCHLAGLSNDPTAAFNPEANWAMNTEATRALGEAARGAGVRRLTFASSASVYGSAHDPALTEDAPVNPQSDYAASKLEAERALLALAAQSFEPVVLRQATVSGWSPRMRWDLVVNTMVKAALTTGIIRVFAGGEAYRPLIDVQDCAEAHVRFLTAPGVGGRVFNVAKRRQPIGDAEPLGEGYTVACLALYVAHLLRDRHGVSVQVEGDWSRGEGRSYGMCSAAMRAALAWEPGRGVRAMVDDLMAHGRDDLHSPETRNIDWMTALDYGQRVAQEFGGVFA